MERLNTDPASNISYRSGNSKFSYPAPTLSNGQLGHRQGISRLHIGEGVDRGNYFVVSASTHGVAPGFEVVRLGVSANAGALGPRANVSGWSSSRHHIVNWVAHDNAAADTNYNHAGGLQVIGRIAVVALEGYKIDRPSDAGFAFWHLRPHFPEASELVQRENESEHGSVEHAGSVGIAQLEDGRYLVLLFGRHAREVEVFSSTESFLSFQAEGWESMGAWEVSQRAGTLAPGDRWHGYQNTQLLTQCDGQLFMLGSVHLRGNDWLHLFRIELEPDELRPRFTKVAERHLYCRTRRTRGREYCNLKAGGGAYVDPDGRLFFYAVEGHSCVGGGCVGRGRRDGFHVGVREFGEQGSAR